MFAIAFAGVAGLAVFLLTRQGDFVFPGRASGTPAPDQTTRTADRASEPVTTSTGSAGSTPTILTAAVGGTSATPTGGDGGSSVRLLSAKTIPLVDETGKVPSVLTARLIEPSGITPTVVSRRLNEVTRGGGRGGMVIL